jgi:aspartokinase
MLSRSSTNQAVWKILRSDLAVQKNLQRNLINSRALAKYVIRKYGLTTSLDAVISSIRRFQGEESFKEEEKSLLNIFKGSIVSTKNNMACLTLNMRPAKFLKKIKAKENGASYRIITSPSEVKVMLEQPQLAEVKKLFEKEEILNVADKLSEIRVKVSETAVKTKGVLARIANELALANINLQEILVCSPRFLIYIKEKDIVKAHDAILKLC